MGNNLAQRATTAVAAQQNGGQPTLQMLIEQLKPQIARALPKHLDPDRIARIALTLIKQTPKLAQCTPDSFLGALMTSAQLGLEPGPLGDAYLVPYGNVVTFIPGYRGLLKLAWQSGMMRTFQAHVVREGDAFDYEFGLDPYLRHKPARVAGNPTDAYAAATFLNGGSAFDVMTVEDVEAIRKRSRSANNGPWVTDWNEMAKKTVIKRLVKMLPLSTELNYLNQAVAMDGTARTDVTDLREAETNYVDEAPAAPEPEYDAEADSAAQHQAELA